MPELPNKSNNEARPRRRSVRTSSDKEFRNIWNTAKRQARGNERRLSRVNESLGQSTPLVEVERYLIEYQNWLAAHKIRLQSTIKSVLDEYKKKAKGFGLKRVAALKQRLRVINEDSLEVLREFLLYGEVKDWEGETDKSIFDGPSTRLRAELRQALKTGDDEDSINEFIDRELTYPNISFNERSLEVQTHTNDPAGILFFHDSEKQADDQGQGSVLRAIINYYDRRSDRVCQASSRGCQRAVQLYGLLSQERDRFEDKLEKLCDFLLTGLIPEEQQQGGITGPSSAEQTESLRYQLLDFLGIPIPLGWGDQDDLVLARDVDKWAKRQHFIHCQAEQEQEFQFYHAKAKRKKAVQFLTETVDKVRCEQPAQFNSYVCDLLLDDQALAVRVFGEKVFTDNFFEASSDWERDLNTWLNQPESNANRGQVKKRLLHLYTDEKEAFNREHFQIRLAELRLPTIPSRSLPETTVLQVSSRNRSEVGQWLRETKQRQRADQLREKVETFFDISDLVNTLNDAERTLTQEQNYFKKKQASKRKFKEAVKKELHALSRRESPKKRETNYREFFKVHQSADNFHGWMEIFDFIAELEAYRDQSGLKNEKRREDFEFLLKKTLNKACQLINDESNQDIRSAEDFFGKVLTEFANQRNRQSLPGYFQMMRQVSWRRKSLLADILESRFKQCRQNRVLKLGPSSTVLAILHQFESDEYAHFNKEQALQNLRNEPEQEAWVRVLNFIQELETYRRQSGLKNPKREEAFRRIWNIALSEAKRVADSRDNASVQKFFQQVHQQVPLGLHNADYSSVTTDQYLQMMRQESWFGRSRLADILERHFELNLRENAQDTPLENHCVQQNYRNRAAEANELQQRIVRLKNEVHELRSTIEQLERLDHTQRQGIKDRIDLLKQEIDDIIAAPLSTMACFSENFTGQVTTQLSELKRNAEAIKDSLAQVFQQLPYREEISPRQQVKLIVLSDDTSRAGQEQFRWTRSVLEQLQDVDPAWIELCETCKGKGTSEALYNYMLTCPYDEFVFELACERFGKDDREEALPEARYLAALSKCGQSQYISEEDFTNLLNFPLFIPKLPELFNSCNVQDQWRLLKNCFEQLREQRGRDEIVQQQVAELIDQWEVQLLTPESKANANEQAQQENETKLGVLGHLSRQMLKFAPKHPVAQSLLRFLKRTNAPVSEYGTLLQAAADSCGGCSRELEDEPAGVPSERAQLHGEWYHKQNLPLFVYRSLSSNVFEQKLADRVVRPFLRVDTQRNLDEALSYLRVVRTDKDQYQRVQQKAQCTMRVSNPEKLFDFARNTIIRLFSQLPLKREHLVGIVFVYDLLDDTGKEALDVFQVAALRQFVDNDQRPLPTNLLEFIYRYAGEDKETQWYISLFLPVLQQCLKQWDQKNYVLNSVDVDFVAEVVHCLNDRASSQAEKEELAGLVSDIRPSVLSQFRRACLARFNEGEQPKGQLQMLLGGIEQRIASHLVDTFKTDQYKDNIGFILKASARLLKSFGPEFSHEGLTQLLQNKAEQLRDFVSESTDERYNTRRRLRVVEQYLQRQAEEQRQAEQQSQDQNPEPFSTPVRQSREYCAPSTGDPSVITPPPTGDPESRTMSPQRGHREGVVRNLDLNGFEPRKESPSGSVDSTATQPRGEANRTPSDSGRQLSVHQGEGGPTFYRPQQRKQPQKDSQQELLEQVRSQVDRYLQEARPTGEGRRRATYLLDCMQSEDRASCWEKLAAFLSTGRTQNESESGRSFWKARPSTKLRSYLEKQAPLIQEEARAAKQDQEADQEPEGCFADDLDRMRL